MNSSFLETLMCKLDGGHFYTMAWTDLRSMTQFEPQELILFSPQSQKYQAFQKQGKEEN
jgi:hypothetical protein